MIINTKDVMEKFLQYLRQICPVISSSLPGKEKDDKATKIAQKAQKNIQNFCAIDPLLMSGIIPELEEGQKFYQPLFGLAYIFAKMGLSIVPCKPELAKTLDKIASFLKFQDKELEKARFMVEPFSSRSDQAQQIITDEAKDNAFNFAQETEILAQAGAKEAANHGLSILDLVLMVLENQIQESNLTKNPAT